MKHNTVHQSTHEIGQQLRGVIKQRRRGLMPATLMIAVPTFATWITALESDIVGDQSKAVIGASVTFTLSTFSTSGAWRAIDVRVEPSPA